MKNNKTVSDLPKAVGFETAVSDHPEIQAVTQKTFFPGGALNTGGMNVKTQRDVDARVGDFAMAVEELGWKTTLGRPCFIIRADGTLVSSMMYRRKLP